MSTSCKTADRIRELNDTLRPTLIGGTGVFTVDVGALDPDLRSQLLTTIRAFDDFVPDNDPHGEHDFRAIETGSQTFFFKIDYYDRTLTFHSPDAANPSVTRRVLTVMRADEY